MPWLVLILQLSRGCRGRTGLWLCLGFFIACNLLLSQLQWQALLDRLLLPALDDFSNGNVVEVFVLQVEEHWVQRALLRLLSA